MPDVLIDQLRFAGGLALLGAASVVIAARTGARLGWSPVWALVRASIQLAVIALILRSALTIPGLVAAFVALMLTTASWTSGRRLAGLWRRRIAAPAGVVTGSAVALGPVFALGLVQFDERYVIATAGIVVGNAMTASTLAGRNFIRAARHRRDEVEGWLALGALPQQAHRDIASTAVRESVLPTVDQTRSTGLVTLPGAFVGALFGGASPAEAARFQLVVLAAIVLAMLVSATVVTALAGRSPYVAVAEADVGERRRGDRDAGRTGDQAPGSADGRSGPPGPR